MRRSDGRFGVSFFWGFFSFDFFFVPVTSVWVGILGGGFERGVWGEVFWDRNLCFRYWWGNIAGDDPWWEAVDLHYW